MKNMSLSLWLIQEGQVNESVVISRRKFSKSWVFSETVDYNGKDYNRDDWESAAIWRVVSKEDLSRPQSIIDSVIRTHAKNKNEEEKGKVSQYFFCSTTTFGFVLGLDGG